MALSIIFQIINNLSPEDLNLISPGHTRGKRLYGNPLPRRGSTLHHISMGNNGLIQITDYSSTPPGLTIACDSYTPGGTGATSVIALRAGN
jgi:hypothetical protein